MIELIIVIGFGILLGRVLEDGYCYVKQRIETWYYGAPFHKRVFDALMKDPLPPAGKVTSPAAAKKAPAKKVKKT